MPERAPTVTGTPGSFARSVLAERHPVLVEQVRDAFPYGPDQHAALDALLEEIGDDVVTPLNGWAHWHKDYVGRSWFEVPFLWAESYFYRRLLEAVGYFGPGPWQGVDPFAPVKRAELRGEVVDEELRALDGLADLPRERQAAALLHASLWGNRADLGFRAGGGGEGEAVADLVADDSARLWSLLADRPGTVAVVADNAGRELVPDLILADHVLGSSGSRRVALYVKPSPYFVSDATTDDVVDALRRLTGAPGRAGGIGGRLWRAMGEGRLEVRTHAFFSAPLAYAEMPGDLRAEFADAALTVMKGDLNYRRLVGDRLWPATVPFSEVTAHFPGPVVALRTLKCDVVTGLDARTLGALEASGQEWRTSGTHALVQAGGHGTGGVS